MINPDENKPMEWFEPLYAKAEIDGKGVPWAHMNVHPFFEKWLKKHPLQGNGQKALVVACGMGDDAVTLEELGFDVTAFDVSPSAINFCKQRFPEAQVNFLVADLFNYPAEWQENFDFVLEIFTIQALPPRYEDEVIKNIASLVKPGGKLLVISIVNEAERDFAKGPPWLLTPAHRLKFEKNSLEIIGKMEEPSTKGNNHIYISFFQKLY